MPLAWNYNLSDRADRALEPHWSCTEITQCLIWLMTSSQIIRNRTIEHLASAPVMDLGNKAPSETNPLLAGAGGALLLQLSLAAWPEGFEHQWGA